ncbi:RNA-binding protein, putative [Plasmodium gallinaceum]|uniref:RNA-binding protein, putative n=1 Tax=Plasmodium gallinaceum TaxID=5849 RepID=A0A1J1GN37_PLAGA|nr:RNA-binding protein, putative [Plasmodium gallinaceum]CRG93871.1 RNA-binding protein, putative [Plasmodium gallinaceum]
MNNSNKISLIGEKKDINNSYNTKTLWVGDLDKIKDEIVDENYILYCMFYEFTDDIIKIKLCKEKNSQKNSYAFIEFSNFEIARYCFDNLNGKWIPGKIHKFKLNWAKYNMTDNINQSEKNLDVELDDKGTYSIYVGSLPPCTTKEEIENLFRNFYNSICFVKMIKNCNKNQNKIYCFVHFFDYEECIRALTEMDGYILKGYKIKVSKSNGIKINNSENNNYCANQNYNLDNNNLNNGHIRDFNVHKNKLMNNVTDEQKKNKKNYYFYYNNSNNELSNAYKINYYDYDHLNSSINSYHGYNNSNILYDSNNYNNHINQISNYNVNMNQSNNYISDTNQLNNYIINYSNKTDNLINYNMNNLNHMSNFNYAYSENNGKINLYEKKDIDKINDISIFSEQKFNDTKENEGIQKESNSFCENLYELSLCNNTFSNEDYNNFRASANKNNRNNDNNNISNYENNINNINKHDIDDNDNRSISINNRHTTNNDSIHNNNNNTYSSIDNNNNNTNNDNIDNNSNNTNNDNINKSNNNIDNISFINNE